MSTTAYVALGSNVGDRAAHLQAALAALGRQAGIRAVAVSRNWETAPVGGPAGQANYLNAAARLETELPAHALLNLFLAIEQKQGRVRTERNGPRTLDLDLLLYGDAILDEPGLTVPHPRMHERVFVLGPLAEIAPMLEHPIAHRTMLELLVDCLSAGARLDGTGGQARFSPFFPRALAGRRAVVTGASSGIGRAIALALADQGADVVVHCRQSRSAAEQVCDQVQQRGVRGLVLTADLRAADARAQFVDQAWAELGPIGIWINNAGVDTLTGPAASWSFEEKLDQLLAVDVTATMLLARSVGQRMRAAGQGVILNMGWDQAETGMEGDSGQLFAAAKGAVMAFTKSLALSLAPEVRVNCLAPGWIRTAWGQSASAVWQERAVREAPLKRWGTPDDVAQLACWLVSPAAAFITGQVLRVNGGAVR